MAHVKNILLVSVLALSLSACAVTNGQVDKQGNQMWAKVEGVPAPSDFDTPEGKERLTRDFENSRKCRFVIKSVENSSSQNATILVGPKRDARNVYKEASVFARSGGLVTLGPSDRNSQGFANPGQIIFGKILKSGQQSRIVPVGRMPKNCDSRSDNTLPDLFIDLDVREFSGKTFLLPF